MKFSKKAGVALAVSAAFIATSALPAFAASQVDFSGYYRAKFHTYGNTGYNGAGAGIAPYYQDKHSDTWFKNRFRLNMNIQATDEISIHTRWQGSNDKKWGQDQGDVNVNYAFGQVNQDWGTIQVGRLNDQDGIGHAGLKTMGWDPLSVDGDEENYRPFDTGAGGDGINYFNTWDNGFSFELGYLKVKSEDDAGSGDKLKLSTSGSDNDYDRFQTEGRYQWDTGAASLAVAFERDASDDWKDGKAIAARNYSSSTVWEINPAFMQTWGAFSTHAEAMFAFGKFNMDKDSDGSDKTLEILGRNFEDKVSGQGFYIDFDYNYGPGRVNLAGWWTSGTKADADKTKIKTLPNGMGKGFNPLLVLYDGGALKAANFGASVGDYDLWRGNHWAIDLNGQHAFTDEITARWAIAYAALSKANYINQGAPGDQRDQKKDIGWEADLGLDAEILTNLHLYSGFGYLFAGDALATQKDGKWESPDDGYAWINTLYFNF